jgi:hypothetical protein
MPRRWPAAAASPAEPERRVSSRLDSPGAGGLMQIQAQIASFNFPNSLICVATSSTGIARNAPP